MNNILAQNLAAVKAERRDHLRKVAAAVKEWDRWIGLNTKGGKLLSERVVLSAEDMAFDLMYEVEPDEAVYGCYKRLEDGTLATMPDYLLQVRAGYVTDCDCEDVAGRSRLCKHAVLLALLGGWLVPVPTATKGGRLMPSPKTKSFHLGDVLSVTTGKLASPSHMDGLYKILNYMTRDNLYTHQLPRARRECEPELLRQFPQLVGLETPEFTEESEVKSWLAEQVTRFSATLKVSRLAANDHTFIDPLKELESIVGPGKIVVIVAPEGDDDADIRTDPPTISPSVPTRNTSSSTARRCRSGALSGSGRGTAFIRTTARPAT